MEYLQANLAAFFLYRLGDQLVAAHLAAVRELGAKRRYPARPVGRDAPGDNQPHPAAGTLSKIGRHPFKAVFLLFQAGMHRPHEDAVFQHGKAQVERREQMWI